MASARERMARWLNVEPDEVSFGPSTSQNTYVVGQALRETLSPGDEVVVTNQDHEANIGSWRRLEAAGVVIREWQVDPVSGELNPDDLDAHALGSNPNGGIYPLLKHRGYGESGSRAG